MKTMITIMFEGSGFFKSYAKIVKQHFSKDTNQILDELKHLYVTRIYIYFQEFYNYLEKHILLTFYQLKTQNQILK